MVSIFTLKYESFNVIPKTHPIKSQMYASTISSHIGRLVRALTDLKPMYRPASSSTSQK